jgi:predicted transcriptional regulator of viral defense system
MTNTELALRELANNQGGYFTARQAETLGFVRNHHAYHVSTGKWVREARGIYRLAGVRVDNPAMAELHLWLLWTVGRKADAPRGALAYETALSVFDLSDLIINKIHLSVPKDFRPAIVPKAVVLHREDRDASEITGLDGLRVVRPFRAVIDLLREGRVSVEHIERGFKDGIRKGVITIPEVKKAKLSPDERRLVSAWMKEAA